MIESGDNEPGDETIARGYASPNMLLPGGSTAGHRAVLLDCDSTAVGIGILIGADGPWWTADFGYS